METPEKIDWSKANKDNIPVDEEPELDKNEEKPLHPIWDKCSIENHINEMVKQSEKEEPTFKAGDEVEYYCVGAEKWLPAIYAFFTNNRHWIYTDGDKQDGFNMRCAWSFSRGCFRKPDPDKVYREMAKEIMTKEGIDDLGEYTTVEILSGKIESMLIEALKKGKEL